MALKQFDPSKFTSNSAKPMPVFLLLDISGSMGVVMDNTDERMGPNGEVLLGDVTRIDVLNQAVGEMLSSFAKEEQSQVEFLVSVITFGGSVRLHLPPTKASKVVWEPLAADGLTPLGEALAMAKGMIEDKAVTPSRAYRPVIVLVSDGQPTDTWEEQLNSFTETGRSMKCDRVALAIGAGTDEEMLKKFIANTPNPLFHATDASHILDVFRQVTMSVTVRSRSKNPNQAPSIASLTDAPAAGEEQNSPATPPSSPNDSEDGYW